jgi:SAM-dependent methyltransferase
MYTYMSNPEYYEQTMSQNWVEELGDDILLNFITGNETKIYEPGSGTGLFTSKLLQLENINTIFSLDPHVLFFNFAKNKFINNKNVKLICDSAINYKLKTPVDIIVARYVYHHIPDFNKVEFLKSLSENLTNDGIIIIKDWFIPHYHNQKQKIISLESFHKYKKSLYYNEIFIQSEIESLSMGKKGIHEHKVSKHIFEKHIFDANLKITHKQNIFSNKISFSELLGLNIYVLKK